MPNAIFVYLHGFLSSPRSIKAQQVVQFVASHNLSIECRVPAIPEEPHRVLTVVEAAIQQACADNSTVALLGSSLGGFYATVLAERHGLRAVMINPSVNPHLRFGEFVRSGSGDMVNPYSDRRFTLGQRDLDALEAMSCKKLTKPENYWLLAQMGDEVLDYRNAVAYYTGCKQTIEAGGDHAFQGFERYLPDIIKFLQCAPN